MGERTRVRLARIAQGLSQQGVAVALGVSRQAVAGIEAGSFDPSLKVALSLASVLGESVEELFGPVEQLATLEAIPLLPFDGASRADVARVGSRLVALGRHGDSGRSVGFASTGSLIAGMHDDLIDVIPTRPVRPGLVVAGCDPAIGLLSGPLLRLDPPVELNWWSCSSMEALKLLEQGLVHVAGFHVRRDEVATIPELLSFARDLSVFAFTAWQEGIASRPELAIRDLEEAIERRLVLANREPGSEARHLLEGELGRRGLDPSALRGWESTVRAHILVASAISASVADFGVTTEPVAIDYDLRFTSLASERSMFAVPSSLMATPEVRALFRVLGGSDLHSQLSVIPGYSDLDSCGEECFSL
ncbi:MAG: substrate-binding domain-containing protein [Ferrimicrobium sp.]